MDVVDYLKTNFNQAAVYKSTTVTKDSSDTQFSTLGISNFRLYRYDNLVIAWFQGASSNSATCNEESLATKIPNGYKPAFDTVISTPVIGGPSGTGYGVGFSITTNGSMSIWAKTPNGGGTYNTTSAWITNDEVPA